MTPLSKVLKAPGRAASPRLVVPACFAPLMEIEAPPAAAPAAPTPPTPPPADSHAEERAEALLHERRREAEQLLAEAQAQAASLLAEAQERAQAAEAEARERGFRSGLEAAREAQRLLLADLEALRAEARAERERFFADLEPEVVRLALAIAEKIIRQEVDLHPEIVVGVARAALNELKEAQSVRVAAHPADVDLLRQHLQPMPGGLTEVTVHPDPQVTRGGCRVDSDRGSADACLERQLERAAAAIQGGEL